MFHIYEGLGIGLLTFFVLFLIAEKNKGTNLLKSKKVDFTIDELNRDFSLKELIDKLCVNKKFKLQYINNNNAILTYKNHILDLGHNFLLSHKNDYLEITAQARVSRRFIPYKLTNKWFYSLVRKELIN